MTSRLISLLLLLILLSACQPVTPAAQTPTPRATLPPVLVPTDTPEVVITHPELEVITPGNVKRLTQVARWGDGRFYDYAVSPDQLTIAVSTATGVRLYDSFTLEEKSFIELSPWFTADEYFPVAFSPDGTYLAYSDGLFVYLFNLETKENERRFVSPIPEYHVAKIAISKDNRHMILETKGSSLQCDGPGGNFALYDLSDSDGSTVVYDRYFCGPSLSGYRFTETGKAYFFIWYATNHVPSAMDVVDLTSNIVVERVSYDREASDPLKTFYDISPDGRILASVEGSYDGSTTRLIDAGTGETIETIDDIITFIPAPLPGEPAWQEKYPEFNPMINGTCQISLAEYEKYHKVISDENIFTLIIYYYSSPRAIEVWDTLKCEKVKEITPHSASRVVFNPDGQLLATMNGLAVDVWDVRKGEVRFRAPTLSPGNPVNLFNFTHDSRYLVTGTRGNEYHDRSDTPADDYSVAVWDTRTGERVRTFDSDDGYLRNILTGPGNDVIAISDSAGVDFFDSHSGKPLVSIAPGMIAFTKEGDRVWLVGDRGGSISLFDIRTGGRVRHISIPYYSVDGISLSKDNSRIALKVNIDWEGNIVILDIETGVELERIPLERPFQEIMADGDIYITQRDDGLIDFWEFQAITPLWADSIAFSLANDLLISPDQNRLRYWEISTGDLLYERYQGLFELNYSMSGNIAISPDGRLLVMTSEDGLLRIWGVTPRMTLP